MAFKKERPEPKFRPVICSREPLRHPRLLPVVAIIAMTAVVTMIVAVIVVMRVMRIMSVRRRVNHTRTRHNDYRRTVDRAGRFTHRRRVNHARFLHDDARRWTADDNSRQRRQGNADMDIHTRARRHGRSEKNCREKEHFFHMHQQT
jgi:hypothetical protein